MRLSSVRASLLGIAIAGGLVGCGDDPVSYSAPVAIQLKAKASDTSAGVITEDKSITTESGNPYGAFVADARQRLGGVDPGTIDVDRIELLLGAGSTGVTRLGEVFTGSVEVLFEINDTGTTYPVARLDIPASAGPGPLSFDAVFDAAAVGPADHTKMLGGSFKVVARGPAAAGFTSGNAEAELQTTFVFAAFE